jgi:hypothetical protein
MASISDLILKQVTSSAGKIDIPAGIKDKVLGGLSDSIVDSLTQTAAKSGGIDMIKDLVTGKTKAAASPITSLATNLFTKNILGKMDLGSSASALTGLIPGVLGNLSSFIKDQDGDGDIDLQDFLAALSGGKGGILQSAGSLLGGLGGLFKK